MGDYVPASLTIYNVGGKEAEIARVLDWHDFSAEWGGGPEVRADRVVHGGSYYNIEASLDAITSIGEALEALNVSDWGCQDAKYEYDGGTRIYTPELGVFVAFGSQHGVVLVNAEVVQELLAEAQEQIDLNDPDALAQLTERVAYVDQIAGGPWVRAMNALAANAKSLAVAK